MTGSEPRDEAAIPVSRTPLWQPWFMTLTAAAYTWQVHGWIAGAVMAVLMQWIFPLPFAFLYYWRMNKAIKAARSGTPDDDFVEISRIIRQGVQLRWGFWVLVMVGIGVSGMEACHQGASGILVCERVF